ncbi:MAG: hypothetical protein KGR26_01305, partial [Cyanobacteria bacterium REEB65]|nr:hypothetical protein [Cyanobacteria bacterium REEB65]
HPVGRRVADSVLASGRYRIDHNSVMVTRQAFSDAGGWDDDPSLWREGDAAFWDRLSAAGYEFVPVDDPELSTDVHTYHENSVDMKVRSGREPWS